MNAKARSIVIYLGVSLLIAGSIGWASAGAPGAPSWMHDRMARMGMSGHGHCGGCGSSIYDAPAGTDVTMVEVKYRPQTLRVRVGDTVTWANLDEFEHTVTSDEGAFDSGLLGGGQTWSFTFSQPGTYRYHCTPHAMRGEDGTWFGQTGTIVVA